MDLPSPGSPDKLSILSRNDSSLHKEKDDSSHSSEVNEPQDLMVQRCVIIQKDEKGYGLTVSGDNPVFVQSVKEDGAAARAGVQQGDRIIKVNGTLVTQSNHQEVVELIKSGSYVALTLLGKPLGHNKGSLSPQQSFSIPGSNVNTTINNSNKSPSSDMITAPQPVDPEKQQQLTNSRIHTIRKMLEREVVYLENLRSEFSKTPSEKIRSELNGAAKRVKTLEEQLKQLTGITHEHVGARSPKSPTASRHNYDKETHCRSVSFPTPGQHNRPLIHQISAPALPANQDLNHPVTSSPDSNESKYHITLTPCTESHEKYDKSPSTDLQKQTLSTSLENIVKHINPRTTTWPQHTHTRQSSSPETLVHGLENLKCQKSNGVPRSESLYRSPSAVSPIGGYRSLSSDSESKSSHPVIASRGSSLGQYDSPQESPITSVPQESEEPSHTGDNLEGDEGVSHEEYGTPPESSTNEINLQSVVSKLGQNPNIICMEDDDFSSDTEMGHLEDHGPFSGLWKLVRHPAHLSVFLHYLMSNSDPSSLFFYLISNMYQQGTAKEMKKWAYEIHSSFLVPGAPLKVSLVDETILHEIDEVLLNNIDKEEVLRDIFKEARKKAKEELNDLLADFRNKRTMGLANIFGPPDYQLEEAMHDKIKESKVIEQVLVPCLENAKPYIEDLEGVDDRATAKAYALATIMKQFGAKSPPVLERCPTFVAKEKSLFRFLQRNKKVVFIQGHHFIPQHYYSVTFCNHCQLIIWGVGDQGYQCQNCEMNIHKPCAKVVEEHCIGALRHKKDKPKERSKRDRKSYIMENIIGKTRKPSHTVPGAIEKARKLNEEMNADNGLPASDSNTKSETGEKGAEDVKESSELVFQNMVNLSESIEKSNINKKSAASIGRSESFRQRRESKPSFRKRSDPNIPRSKSDVDVDEKNTGLNESRSSSNSSLSNRSLDSPCNSSEMVHRTPTSVSADSVPPNFAPNVTSSGGHTTMHSYDDSDLEAEVDPPNWQENVDWEVLKVMKPKEKKRQDVINELFHTERTHVRNLKVLDRLFYRPMIQEQLLPADFISLLFPNLEEMLEIHSNFNQKMKARRKEEHIIGDIGQLMLEMFDGPSGEHLKHAAATYCENQSIALESLKMRQKKDQKLAQSLSDAEMNNLCRRLQLKDIIASGFQRLTKYPLLLENIAKYTPPNTQELLDLQRSIECSKEILVHVDAAIKEAENRHRLHDIQKKIENKIHLSSFEKVEHPKGGLNHINKDQINQVNKEIQHSFQHLDVTKHKLVHEGPLTWRLNKQKNLEMHVVLLEDLLILFQKQDEKYVLKFHNTNLTSGREDTKRMYSPILRVNNLLIRNNASDKRSIFLISSSEMHAMYEFVAATASEKKIWCQHLNKAVEEKTQSGNLLKMHQEPVPATPDSTITNDEASEEPEIESKEPETTAETPAVETIDDSQTYQPNNSPETPQPPAEPELPPPSVPPDETPQRARRVIQEDDENESDKESGPQKRFQRIEILQVTEAPQLIEPSEVIVSSGAIYETAEPVLTPVEKLRRKDLEIVNAIEEKEKILAEMFQVPYEEFKASKEVFPDVKEVTTLDLIKHAVQQANKLTSLVNDGLNLVEDPHIPESTVSEDEGARPSADPLEKSSPFSYFFRPQGVSHQTLMPVSSSLNTCLLQLMDMIRDVEEERIQLRKELSNCRDQIHQLHENHRHCVALSQSPNTHSRPSSFVSVASTASDGIAEFFEHQQLFSVLEKTEETSTLDSESAPQESSSKVLSSSPVNEESSLPSERWEADSSAPEENRTCDEQQVNAAEQQPSALEQPSCALEQSSSALNCDVLNSENTICTSEDLCKAELSPILESDSVCRTVQDEQNVDPVYL